MVGPSGRDPAAAFVRRFPWSRSRTVLLVDALLVRLPTDEHERCALAARARAHARDCGCATGGAFLGVALVLTVLYLAATADMRVRTLVASAAFVLLATLLGKVAGLLLAWLKLAALQRSLSRRVGGSGSKNVHVH